MESLFLFRKTSWDSILISCTGTMLVPLLEVKRTVFSISTLYIYLIRANNHSPLRFIGLSNQNDLPHTRESLTFHFNEVNSCCGIICFPNEGMFSSRLDVIYQICNLASCNVENAQAEFGLITQTVSNPCCRVERIRVGLNQVKMVGNYRFGSQVDD